jgi:NAD(P)-dependent dehydrogenase (short-subunit alcohol dehydrogenase family)
LATAKLFVKERAHVFITGRRQKELDEAVATIGCNVTGIQGDIAKLTDLDRLYEVAASKGRIDVVFANAGVPEFAPLGKITEEHFDKLFDINVKGTLFTVQKALPLLNDCGSIILNGSIASCGPAVQLRSDKGRRRTNMRAMRAERFSGYEALRLVELPKPAVTEGNVLVRITAAGVTPLDHTILFGNFHIPEVPLVLGNEGAGVVEEGSGADFPAGSRVMFWGTYGAFEDGTYREWIAVRKEDLSRRQP